MAKSYYPVNLDIEGKKCIVAGGGKVAERKVIALLKFGAAVAVVSSSFTDRLRCLARERKIKLVRRKYRAGDLTGAVLAIAATNDAAVNRKVCAEAQKRNVLVNVVDRPALCSFIAPSIVQRGPLVISISTSGRSPALARALRLKLEKTFPSQIGGLVEELGRIRVISKKGKNGTPSFRA